MHSACLDETDDGLVPGHPVPLAEACHRPPRRVGPWIDLDEFLDGTDAPPILPNSPAALRPLHELPRVKALVRMLDDRLRTAIERPVVVHPCRQPGRRELVILFSAIVELDGPRIVSTWWVPNEESIPPWTESTLPAYAQAASMSDVVIEPVPCLWLWLERAMTVVGFWLRSPGIGHGDLVPAYLSWLRGQMRRRHWTPAARRAVREALREAFALDPAALDLAQRIRLRPGEAAAVSAERYVHALDHGPAMQEVQRVAPGLLPLYALVAGVLPSEQEPLAALRQWVLDDPRLKPRHWRWLQRHGTRWLWRPMGCLWFVGPADVRELLALACDFEFEGPIPVALLMGVVHLSASADRPAASAETWALERLVRPLGRWWNRCPASDRPALQQVAPALVNWLYRSCRDADLHRLMHMGWRRAVAAMHEDDARIGRGFSNPRPVVPPVDLAALRHGALRVRGVDSPAALWAESRAMQHCADSFLPLLRRGRHRMLSIFHDRTQRRVATLLVRRGAQGWEVERLSGHANREVSPAVRQMAQRVCDALDRLAPRRGPASPGSGD